MKKQTDLTPHMRILGILFIVFSALNIFILLIVSSLLGIFLPDMIPDPKGLLASRIVLYAIWTVIIVFTIPAIVAGIGLLYKKKWALTLALIVGIINLPGFPIWTMIGIYTIVVFIISRGNQSGTDWRDVPKWEC